MYGPDALLAPLEGELVLQQLSERGLMPLWTAARQRRWHWGHVDAPTMRAEQFAQGALEWMCIEAAEARMRALALE